MKRIAFIKFAGLASGGCEKYLQTIACILVDYGLEVDYYYTNAAPYINWDSPFVHPDNCDSRKVLLQNKGVNLIPVHVTNKDGSGPPYTWLGTDFWEAFDETKYDIISSARSGYPEYPFTHIHTTPIIDTIHSYTGEDKSNIHKAILLCEWQANLWSSNGGNSAKQVIIPSLVKIPDGPFKDLRDELGIPRDAFVYGFHQGDREDIFSPASLMAYKALNSPDSYFVIMGGAQKHREAAAQLQLTNIKFVNFSSSPRRIHEFLSTLDVFAHARHDGEVCSAALIEALFHGLPIISHPAMNMGHAEQVAGCGKLVESVPAYTQEMLDLSQNKEYYRTCSTNARSKYLDLYDYRKIKEKIINTYTQP